MPNVTKNYGLKKPLPEEFYDVQVHNENMDIVDAELKKKYDPNNKPTANDIGAVKEVATYIANNNTSFDLDTATDSLLLIPIGVSKSCPIEDTFVYIRQLFYSAVSETANRIQIAYPYSPTALHSGIAIRNLKNQVWGEWKQLNADIPITSEVPADSDIWIDPNEENEVITLDKLGGAPMTYAKKVGAPYNELDNSNFRNPVNQRGLTTHTTNGATIDRWNKNDNIASVDVVAGGVSVTAKSGNYGYFEQKKENGTLLGKKLTFAVKTKNGLYVITGECPTSATSESVQFGGGMFDGFRMYMRLTEDVVAFQTRIDAGKTIVFEWAAVYEGEYTLETLPEYQPKGYATELSECQRYYRVFDRDCIGNGYVATDGKAVLLHIPFTMRIPQPTVVWSDTLYCRVNGADYTVTSLRVYNTDNCMRVALYASGMPAKHVAAVWGTSLFALNADL